MAPAPAPRDLSQEEMSRLCRQREAVLRELRVFLRDATNKLLAERKFKEFTKYVDVEEVHGLFLGVVMLLTIPILIFFGTGP